MKSGLAHLQRKPEPPGESKYPRPTAVESPPEDLRDNAPPECELDQPIWAVVSFDKMEVGGLTYRQASTLVSDLLGSGMNGLCIVTDKAAANVNKRR